jgi:hypothetical protein
MTTVDLVTARWTRRRTVAEPVPVGITRVSPPVVDQVSGRAASAVRLTVELDAHSADLHFVAAFLRLDFHTADVTAAELRITDRPAGNAAEIGAERVATSVCVLPGGMVGWLVGDPLSSTPMAREFTVHALLSTPAGVSALTVTTRLDATLVRPGKRHRQAQRSHAHSRNPAEFALQLPGDETANRTGQPAAPASVRGTGAVRLCLAADIQQFSRFRSGEAIRAQQRFVDALAQARRYAGIDEETVKLQESGDGQYAVLPTGLDESTAVPRLIEGLRVALAQLNSDLNARARLRLRVALHRGHIAPGANGWVGDSSIAIHRMLDSEPVRTALADNEGADFALIVPEVLYREIISQGYETLDPAEFNRVDVVAPAKGFAAAAWVYLPKR